MLNTSLILIYSTFFLVAYLFWKWKTFADSLPQGPRAWPIVGNLLQLDKDDCRKTFVEWHKKYGPIFSVWLGIEPYLFITGYDLMQELFVKRIDEFSDRTYSFFMDNFAKGKFGIINAAGEQWRDQRRLCLQTFQTFGYGRKFMEDKIEFEVSKLIIAVTEELGADETKNLNFKPLVDNCVNNIISTISFGHSYDFTDPKLIELKHAIDSVMTEMSATSMTILNNSPILRFVPFINVQYGKIQDAIGNFFAILEANIYVHKLKFDHNLEPTDLVSAYLHEMKRRIAVGEELENFSEWSLVCIIADLWFSGMETTATILSWAILLMMEHPDVQEKVQNEMQSVIGSERFPSMNDRTDLPYTMAVIQEIQRYANISTVNLPCTVNKDTKIGGYTIPKGIAIAPQICVVHLDEDLYDNPEEFLPDRFLESNGKLLDTTENMISIYFCERNCLGEDLAKMEVFLSFTALLQRFNFSFINNEPKPNISSKVGFTVTPNAYSVCIKRR